MTNAALKDFHRETVEKSIEIKASPELVWHALTEDRFVHTWSNVFKADSHVSSDWNPGGRISYVGADGNGFVGKIHVHRPNEELSIEFVALLRDHKEDTESDLARQWVGSMENYFLTYNGDDCILSVEQDVPDSRYFEFENKWDNALVSLKKIAEQLSGYAEPNAAHP